MKRQSILSFIWCALLLLFMGCATTYGPKATMGGYSEIQMDENSFEVTFEGNQHNTADEIRTYLTYRCSELTLEKGFSHFLIMEDLSFKDGGAKEFDETDIVFETHTSMSGGTNSSVRSNFGAQESSSDLVGRFVIRLLHGVDPSFPTASMDAKAFINANEGAIKR